MAHDIPLVLYDCEFPSMEWKSTDDEYRLHRVIQGFTRMQYDLQLKPKCCKLWKILYSKIKIQPLLQPKF